jgi:hypothetical protein
MASTSSRRSASGIRRSSSRISVPLMLGIYSMDLPAQAAVSAGAKCHNPVGVDPNHSSFTQGSSCVATLGWGAQSFWDWADSRIEPLNHDQSGDSILSRRGNSLSMDLCSKFQTLKYWKLIVLDGLTLTLTPALSPGGRGNSFPRIGNMLALDLPRFRGSMREMVRGILSPGERAGVRASFRTLTLPHALRLFIRSQK